MLRKTILITILLSTVFVLAGCKEKEPKIEIPNTPPTLIGDTSISYISGTIFDPVAGVIANDAEDGDLTSSIIVVSNNVNTLKAGTYLVELEVTDSDGNRAIIAITVNVPIALANYPDSIDLSKLSRESKAIIYAALEEYLLKTVSSGVPLYRQMSQLVFSDRVKLFSSEYNGVLEFGIDYSELIHDDSTVIMYDDVYGEIGEYTWRTSFEHDPETLNPWLADDKSSLEFINRFTGGLYDIHFDETKTGYQINPSLASGEPIAVDPEIINGKTYATIWRIPIRDYLVWSFHPDTDTSLFTAGYEKLDASDYLWTWELAISESWFRAISGGGDFISMGIKNAANFEAGNALWADVGLRMAAGETNVLELEFITEKSAYDIKYMFSQASLSPINEELYNSVGELGYGVNPETVASSGIYIFDTWTTGELLLFTKNDNHPDVAMYHYTGYQYRYIDEQIQVFNEFLEGRLDSAIVPITNHDSYYGDSHVKVIPSITTWRLVINGFGTIENRDAYIEQYPDINIDENWVPEPILMYQEMKQALYYGFDRYEAAINEVGTYLPAFTLFPSYYLMDGESRISVRGTEEGAAILETFSGQTYGFLPEHALDLFKSAVEQAINDGYYIAGTTDNYTVIELDLYYSSGGNTYYQAMIAEIKQQYEALLQDDVNYVKIIINTYDVAFPGSYYDHLMPGQMDLGIGAISNAIIRYTGFYDIYGDNNASGFTLNWGIDTHTPNIEIAYTNLDGLEVTEIWSYNALVAALRERTYVRDGAIQTTWETADNLIEAYTYMDYDEIHISIEDSDIVQYLFEEPLEDIITKNGFDELISKIVTTESGNSILYVISVKDDEYSLFDSFVLYTDVEKAIENHTECSKCGIVKGSAVLLKTDDAITGNTYIATAFPDYHTLQDVADDQGTPVEYTEVYSISWDGVYGAWDDAYVVLHIGDYFIAWAWL